MMLPPEILLQIFEYAHDYQRRPISHYSKPSTKTLLSIVLVCREWKSLAEPLLYRQISLDYEPNCNKSIRNELIRDSLRQGRYRHGFVEELLFTYSNKNGTPCDDEILETIQQMSNLRIVHLIFHWGRPPADCALTRRISFLPKLENLASYGAWTGSILRQNMISNSDHIFPALKRWDLCEAEPLEAGCRLPTSRQFVSKLESLFVHYDCHPGILYELLKWPQALKILNIDVRFDRCRYANLYTTDTVQRMLDVQSHSLEEIYLPGYTHDSKIVLPDLAHFTSLRVLELNQNEIFQSKPRTTVEKLCSSSLEVLRINMDPEDQQIRGYVLFDETHANWLLDAVTFYRQFSRTDRLKEIHIHFCWIDDQAWYQQVLSNNPWPNACMAALRPKIAEFGVNLTWPRPALTEEEWVDQDRKQKFMESFDRHHGANSFDNVIWGGGEFE